MEQILSASILTPFPEEKKETVDRMLKEAFDKNETRIVVLDDDPTGVQTVHDISVYTDWTVDSFCRGFSEENKLFYVLTNSRGFTAEETTTAHKEIVKNAVEAARISGVRFLMISRSDSTLRGHYPLETELIARETQRLTGEETDGEILCPYFFEGGRFTIDDTHYVKYGDQLVPAAQTEFAGDKTFGYKHSDLKEYIEEKTAGRFVAGNVVSIGKDEIRSLAIDAITQKLCTVSGFGKVIVNAQDDYDVKVLAIALYGALAKGKRFGYRTAAAFVKAIGNISSKALLTHEELVGESHGVGGIVVVGSHTKKTTAQLEELLTIPGVEAIELNSDLVLEEGKLAAEAERVTRKCEQLIESGVTPVVYTKRKLLTVPDDTPEAALIRSVQISDALQSVVGRLNVMPAFVVAKGGITSSDVGTKALCVKRAQVLGQIEPGIPVWKTGAESRFPGKAYVIFPGNVGEASTLRRAVQKLIG